MAPSSPSSRKSTVGATDTHPHDRFIADGRGLDRQILVVGDGIAAVATAGFLDQAGLDPVIASKPGLTKRVPPEVVLLWRPGLALLERVGLRRPVQRLGTPLDRLACLTSADTWAADRSDSPSLIAVQYDELMTLFERKLLNGLRTTEKSVTELKPFDLGVRAAFNHGVEETFDAVIATERSLMPEPNRMPTAPDLHIWQFEWPTPVPEPTLPVEAWSRTRAAICTPTCNETVVQLVSTTKTADSPVTIAEFEEAFSHLFDSYRDPFTNLKRQNIQYVQQTVSAPVSMHLNGIVLAGAAAHGTAPGGGLGPTLAIEDSWVIADTLAYGPSDLDEAVGQYITRRRCRTAELTSRIEDGYNTNRTPPNLSPPLCRVRDSRSLAFSRILGTQYDGFEGSITEYL